MTPANRTRHTGFIDATRNIWRHTRANISVSREANRRFIYAPRPYAWMIYAFDADSSSSVITFARHFWMIINASVAFRMNSRRTPAIAPTPAIANAVIRESIRNNAVNAPTVTSECRIHSTSVVERPS